MEHTFSRILFHVILSTRKRQNILCRNVLKGLFSYIKGIACNKDVQVLSINAIGNHVHLLIATLPKQSPDELVGAIKASSSCWIHENYANLGNFTWNSGYGIFSVSQSSADQVAEYIVNKQLHHRRITYLEELRVFLNMYDAEYDKGVCLK